MTKPIVLRRERNFSEKLNATVEFIKRNFKDLFKSLVFIAGPALLLTGIAFSEYMSALMGVSMNPDDPGIADDFMGTVGTYYFFVALLTSISTILLSATTVGFMKCYDEAGADQKIEVSDVWAKVKSAFLPLLGIIVLSGILYFIALLLFILPGIYVFVALSLVVPIYIFEKRGVFGSMGRSFELTSGNWWQTFGFLFVIYIIASVMGIIFAVPYYSLFMYRMFTLQSDMEAIIQPTTGPMKIVETVFSAIMMIGYYLVFALAIVGVAFQYFNLVEKKEAKGLIEDIDKMDAGT